MTIKLRRPEPGEERLSWCKNIHITVAAEDGPLNGSIDCQFRILPADEFTDAIQDDDFTVAAFLEDNVRAVKGFKDENGEPWADQDQLEFVIRSAECSVAVFEAYTNHVLGGRAKKETSSGSRGQRTRNRSR